MIERAEAHARLDRVLDALEASERANDPSAQALADGLAHQAFIELAAPTMGDIYAIRQGAAMAAVAPDEVGADRQDALAKGKQPVSTAIIHDSDIRTQARRAVARACLDFSTLLPPGLGNAIAGEMWQLNMGEKCAWLVDPHRVKGLPKNSAERGVMQTTLLCRVYYLSGYTGRSLDEVSQTELVAGSGWDGIKKFRQRAGLQSSCEAWRDKGVADHAAGRPSKPPIASDYDDKQRTKLLRDLATGRAGGTQAG